jgi:hypothetical protein
MSGEQSSEQNHNQSRAMYHLDMCKIQTLDNINKSKLEQILNSGNSCCRSVQNLLSCRLSPNNVNIKIYGILIMRAVVHLGPSY